MSELVLKSRETHDRINQLMSMFGIHTTLKYVDKRKGGAVRRVKIGVTNKDNRYEMIGLLSGLGFVKGVDYELSVAGWVTYFVYMVRWEE